MITRHKAPLSHATIALMVVALAVIIGAILIAIRVGQIGIDPEGNVRFFEWGYCLLERMGCAS